MRRIGAEIRESNYRSAVLSRKDLATDGDEVLFLQTDFLRFFFKEHFHQQDGERLGCRYRASSFSFFCSFSINSRWKTMNEGYVSTSRTQ